MATGNEQNLIWIDLEMTGLDPAHDRIIEIATLVTDANLNILAEGPVIAVHQSDAQLALMDEWNVRTHTNSGLVERVKASIRAKVEHPFHVVKTLFGHRKVRYRGLAKNEAQLYTLFGLGNLLLAKRRLLPPCAPNPC